MQNNKIRLMIVDDSAVYRAWLIGNISKDPRFEIVGYAVNAFDAKQKIQLLKPDILTLDIEMPGMSGLEFLKELLPTNPIPVILVSSLNLKVFDALSAGAVDFVQKPDMTSANRKELFLTSLMNKLVIGSKAKVRIPQLLAPPGTVTPGSSPGISAPARGTGTAGAGMSAGAPKVLPGRPLSPAANQMIIAIGASTGGTEATLEVLQQFPANMPGIVVTQHMPPGFTSMYAERMNRLCKMEVREAKNGDRILPGLVLLAPGGMQMRVVKIGGGYAVNCVEGERVSGHCPSVDVLFDSMAMHVRDKAIGIILTGMGADGAAGLLRMRRNGAYTIGQDRETCVVYGMPMEAYKIGAVCLQSPLGSIAQAVMKKLAAL